MFSIFFFLFDFDFDFDFDFVFLFLFLFLFNVGVWTIKSNQIKSNQIDYPDDLLCKYRIVR